MVGNLLVVDGHMGHGRSCMGPLVAVVVGSHDDMGHRMVRDVVVVGSHPLGHGVAESVHNGGSRRSGRGVVGCGRGSHVESSRVVVHGGRSRPLGSTCHVLGSGNDGGPVERLAGSAAGMSDESGYRPVDYLHRQRK